MARTHAAALCTLAAVALGALAARAAMPPPVRPPRPRDHTPRHTPSGGSDRGRGACRLTLRASPSAGAEGCFTDDRVGGHPGVLVYDCSGEGAAEATFHGAHFAGTISGGRVSLRLATRFHYSDGCDWESEQVIRGDVAARSFEFEYSESPALGQSSCASACHASGTLTASAP